MKNENNSILRVYTAESDELLKKLMYENGDTNRIRVFRYPEVQKSPAEQAKVADVLLDFIKKGYNLTTYTHSEYIINRLIRRIVEDGANNDGSLVQFVEIYFANKIDDEMVVHKIAITSEEGIVEYPECFLSTSYYDDVATLHAINEQMRAKGDE